MNFLKISVCLSFFFLVVYTTISLVFAYKGIEIPEALTQYFFIVFGVEFASQAAIQVAKYLLKKEERADKISGLKENKIPLERKDFEESGSYETEYYDGGTYG